MSKFKILWSHIQKHFYIYGGLVFLAIRLINLTGLPVFNDESIYLNWGKRLFESAGGKFFVPVALDGKQMAVPFIYGLLELLPFDPLLSGRLFSVLISLLTFYSSIRLFEYVIPKEIKEKNHFRFEIIFIISFLIFCPYLLFFDRMAMPDAIVVACYTCGVYLFLKQLDKPELKRSIILGFVIAIGWWFKSTVLLIFPPASLVLLFASIRNRITRKSLLVYSTVSLILFILLIIPLLISPEYQKIPFMEGARLNSFSVLMASPVSVYIDKLKFILFWFISYTSPLLLIGLISGVLLSRKNIKLIYLFLFLIIPILLEGTLVNIFTSRYIVFTVPVFLIISIAGFGELKKWGKLLVSSSLLYSAVFGLLLITNPLGYYQIMSKLPFIEQDSGQYFTGWTSGWGIKEAVEWIKEKDTTKPTFVFLGAVSGNPDDILYVYLDGGNTKVLPYQYIDSAIKTVGPDNANYYFISRGPYLAGLENNLNEIKRYNKPLDKEYIGIYGIR